MPAVAGGQVGATGLGHTSLLDEVTPAGPATVTVALPTVPTVAPPPFGTSTPTTATTKPRTTSPSTTRPPAGGGGTTVTLPPGVPPPPLLTGIPNIPPSTSWSDTRDGVTAHLRIDPPSAVAGQPVRFVIEYSSAEPCCTVMLDFGDGTKGYALDNDRGVCGVAAPLTPGAHRAVATHTYASAGSYKANLFVLAGDGCANPPPLVNGAPQITIHAVAFDACLGVGPGPAAQKGCSPFPPFAPVMLAPPAIAPRSNW